MNFLFFVKSVHDHLLISNMLLFSESCFIALNHAQRIFGQISIILMMLSTKSFQRFKGCLWCRFNSWCFTKINSSNLLMKNILLWISGFRWGRVSLFKCLLFYIKYFYLCDLNNDSVAQLVEHYTFNVVVLGSNPSGITKSLTEMWGFFVWIEFSLLLIFGAFKRFALSKFQRCLSHSSAL